MSELKKIIAQGEGLYLDFKFRIDDQKKIARTLSAFANTQGGDLLIGVKDNGKIVGVEPSEEFHMITGAAEIYCNPPVQFESTIWQEDHKMVLQITIKKSEKIKHKSPDEEGKPKIYIRVKDETTLANKILIETWKYQNKEIRRPEKFDEPQLQLIKAINELQPVTLSKLYRKSELKYRQVDHLLVLFICWNLVEMQLHNHPCTFVLK